MKSQEELRSRISQLRAELAELEDQLEELDNLEQEQKTPAHLPLRLDDYRRYGRQMILPGIGLPGSYDTAIYSRFVVLLITFSSVIRAA